MESISEVFNQLEVLEKKMKNNLNVQDSTITLFLRENSSQFSAEIAKNDSTGEDYVLVTSVVTEEHPVPAVATHALHHERDQQQLFRSVSINSLQSII